MNAARRVVGVMGLVILVVVVVVVLVVVPTPVGRGSRHGRSRFVIARNVPR
jgi:hypothetical protein